MGQELQPRLRLLPRSQAVRVAFVRILIESGEIRPAVDDRLKDEGVVPVAVKVLPAGGVQFQVVVDSLLDVLGQWDRSFTAAFDLYPRRPAPVTPDDRGDAQVSDLAHAQAGPR